MCLSHDTLLSIRGDTHLGLVVSPHAYLADITSPVALSAPSSGRPLFCLRSSAVLVVEWPEDSCTAHPRAVFDPGASRISPPNHAATCDLALAAYVGARAEVPFAVGLTSPLSTSTEPTQHQPSRLSGDSRAAHEGELKPTSDTLDDVEVELVGAPLEGVRWNQSTHVEIPFIFPDLGQHAYL